MPSYYVMLDVAPALDCHKRSRNWMYWSIESLSRSSMPWCDDQGPREVEVHSLRFWRRNRAVCPKSWHHITPWVVSHRYWIVTIGYKIEKRGPQRSYLGPTCFGWPKTELRKPRYKKLSVWGRDRVVGPTSWHHIMSEAMSHRYWIVTTGHKTK